MALTSALALSLAAAIAGVGFLTSEATASSHTAPVADVAASSSAPSASPSPSPSPPAFSPSPAPASPSPTATEPSTEPTEAGAAPTVGTSQVVAPAALGTTATAPANAESSRVGALFTGTVSAGNHSCTASVLHSTTKNLVLTAAHCVSATPDGLLFAPGYRDGKTPYGSWRITKVYTTSGWSQGADPDQDFAILQTAPNGSTNVEDAVGANTLGLDAPFTDVVRLYGYPDSSEVPLLCTNATTRQDTYQRQIDCPSYSGGTSGGPFIDTDTNQVIGLIGGYQQGGDSDDTSYSAYFDHTIGTLYQQAVADSSS
ncbi:trypsin-like serine peptidase [Kitasatospora sp. McL0602]|uniref:trypsin-like serine peptidase n=1 Tax=Kitasatospora sp. McL0602 TaxID=3439530 RepID=UPI003F8C6A87